MSTAFVLAFVRIVFSQESTKGVDCISSTLNIGTDGISGYMQWRQGEWTVLSGFSGFSFNRNVNLKTGVDGDLTIIPEIHWVRWGMSGKYQVNERFALKVGGSYTLVQRTLIRAETKNGVVLSSIKIKPDDFGFIKMEVHWLKLQPFIEVDWFFTSQKKRCRGFLGLGFYYLNRPNLNINYSGFLESVNLEEEIPKVEENLSGYRYYPSLKIGFEW